MTGVSTYRNPLSPPLVVKGRGPFPILLSIPHSGTDYPAWLVDHGPRARAGLGIIPGRTPQGGELWRRKISQSEFFSRWSQAHVAYHEAVAAALAELRAVHPDVLLLDCHSMPPRSSEQSQVVLGDRHGSSCASWLSNAARTVFSRHGCSCTLNDPYAGGWIVERHGRPMSGVHALQVELDRSLYLDAKLSAPGPGFDEVAQLLAALVMDLGEALLARAPVGMAAE